MNRHHLAVFGAALAVLALQADPANAQYGATNGEWRSYGGDVGSTKYSPLDQITADNFEELEIAWRWKSVDTHLAKSEGGGSWLGPATEVFEALVEEEPDRWETDLYSPRPGTSLLIATALMVDGVLYLSTPLYQAAAIDARTGETLWVYDPKAYESGTPAVIPWRQLVGSGSRPGDGASLRTVCQRALGDPVFRAGSEFARDHALHPERNCRWERLARPRSRSDNAAGTTAVEAAVLADDCHRHESGRTRVDDPAWRRGSDPQSPAAA